MQLVLKKVFFLLDFILVSFYTMLYNIKFMSNQGIFMELRVTKDKTNVENLEVKNQMENTDMYTKKISYLTTTEFYKQSFL